MIKPKYKPLKIPLTVNSRYEIRELGGLEFHPGIDYKAPLGTPIYAVDNGYLAVAWNDPPGYGLYVIIDHGHYCSLYAHLSKHILTTGQLIKAGDIIGYVGMTGFTTGPHLHFEIRDCPYSDKNFWLKSYLKGRHVMCIDPEKLIAAAAKIPDNIRYKKYNYRTHELRGEPSELGCKVVKKSNRSIEEPNCINSSFQWWEDLAKQIPYPTSILIKDGVILRNEANHLGDFNAPQSVIYTLKNGEVGMKRVRRATELDYKNIVCGIGGLGLVNTFDKNFKYSPVAEGFKRGYNINGILKDFSDVLRVSNKTVFGYNAVNKKFYLLAVKSMSMTELMALITDNSTGEAYHFAALGDGGGAATMNNEDEMVVKGDGRTTYAMIGFGLQGR